MDATLNSPSLSDMLRDARVAKGLELDDIAEITHVRRDYLLALEEGRYGDLPEDIYARNFLRLYAQAVGLDDVKLLERFSRERRAALGISTVSDAVANSVREVTPKRRNPAALWLPIVILVAVGGLGYFVFNRYLSPSNAGTSLQPQTASGNEAATLTTETEDVSTTPEASQAAEPAAASSTPETTTPETTTEITPPTPVAEVTADTTSEAATLAPSSGTAATTTPPAGAESVRFTLVTTPPGAEATLDNYPFPTRTPFFDAPVTPRAARVLRISLEGYQPYEELIDITQDLDKAVTLVPIGAETVTAATGTPTATPAQGQASGQGQLGITVEAETWLEVYQSTVRGEGERLVYSTVSPGQTFTFNLPVYVHVGNAAGVRLSQDGQDIGLMGSSGEVTGRAFGQPLPPAPTPTPAPAPAEPQPTDPAAEGPQ
jgi:cytoskeleton protein RodZ